MTTHAMVGPAEARRLRDVVPSTLVGYRRRCGARPGRPGILLCSLLAGTILLPGAVSAAPTETAAKERAAKGARSGFRVGTWQIQEVAWGDLSFNGGTPMAVRIEGPTDEKGIPMRPLGPGGQLVYNPTVLAQQGMKRLDTWLQTGKAVHLRYARKYAEKLDELATDGQRRRWQPHEYIQGGETPGWVNANSHGLVLSFLSRFYRLIGSDGRLADARAMIPPFARRPDDRRWFAVVTPSRHLWFEHWPGGRYVHTLNGHINALFGLYDLWSLTRSPKAERYFLAGARTVRAKLGRFRREGRLSRYSLSSKSGSLHYHHTHIHQLRLLSLMTADPWFAEQAAVLKQDERAWRAAGKPD